MNVSKHYGRSIILKDINFALNKGEIVGQVGRNGVGKSTLMKILVQNNQPTSGNIISSDNVLKKFVRGFFSWRAGF
ncbi:TPA: ATP-binding cassette domain-containing protein [Streptococcus pneumoniae]